MPKLVAAVAIQWHPERLKEDVERETNRRLDKAAERLKDRVKVKLSRGRRPVNVYYPPGEPPHVDLGHLRNSIFWKESGHLERIVGTKLLVGLFLELGAHIVAKKAKFLTIPATEEARKHARFAGARMFPIKLVMLKKNGIPFALAEIKKGQPFIVHFWLKREVTKPPRPFLRPALYEFGPELQQIFSTA